MIGTCRSDILECCLVVALVDLVDCECAHDEGGSAMTLEVVCVENSGKEVTESESVAVCCDEAGR